MRLLYCGLLLVIFVSSISSRRSRQVSGGQERGGVGIQLPSISLWPWRQTGDRKHRAVVHKPQVSNRRQDDNRVKPQQPKVLFKKPTGLEKKPFGPKYPPKKVNPKYVKFNRAPIKPVSKAPVNPKKVRLAPIPDLRPTSIDRIDILRPQKLSAKQPFPGKAPQFAPGKAPVPAQARLDTVRSRPVQSGIKIVNTKLPVNNKPRVSPRLDVNNDIIEFNESPVEVNGLKLFMFRGDEGIGASDFTPFSPSVSGHYTPTQVVFSQQQPSIPTLQYNSSPFQWSKAEIRPSNNNVIVNTTPRYYNEVAPPFPTRHTTPSPLTSDKPIVIISQSNVAQN